MKTLQILERAHFPKGKSYLNRFLFYGILIIWGLSIVLPIFYFLFQWIFIYNLGFINGAIGNWFATIVGVLAGVPPALWLAGWQQKIQELRDEKRLEIGLLNKEIEILELIEREIEYNRETPRSIEHVESDLVEYDARPLLRSSFKDELWRALSDGESVRYIRNLQLLDSIGKTYHLIRELKYLDDKMLFIYCISRSSQDELNTLFGEIESQVINSSYPLFDTTSALLGELGAELCTLRKRRESIAE